jgi:hypothetical protein
MITLGWPQVIWIALVTVSTAYHCFRHGDQRTDKYNGVATVVAALLGFGLLYWGGFFNSACQG